MSWQPPLSRTVTTRPSILWAAALGFLPPTHTHFQGHPGGLWAPRVGGELPGLTPADSGPCLLVDSPHSFPFPTLDFPTSPRSREFPRSPGCSTGCWPAHNRLPGLYHPALRARREPGVSNRDSRWCTGWGTTPIGGKVLGRQPAAWAGQHLGAVFAPWGRRLPGLGEMRSGALISYHENELEGRAPPLCFDKSSH